MRRLLRAKFLPVNHKQEAFSDYHNLKQGSLTVEEFIVAFDQARLRCGIEEKEEQLIARFLGALRSDIADIVCLQQYWTFSDVCLLAHREEKQLTNKPKPTNCFPPIRTYPAQQPPTKTEPTKPVNQNPPPTVTPAAQPAQSIQPQRCYKCHGLGHLKRDCPNKQVVALVDDPKPVYDSKPEDDSPDPSHLVLPDTGEALVIQRVLTTTLPDSSDDTSWLQNTIFRTKCTAKGKVCTIIIDGGSCENIVSSTMVDKLGLQVHDHPEPYQLTWLKKGTILKVTHSCLVQFSIGDKYADEVWCEVLPMDVCHVLLGRPWQYDRRAKHDGFRNTYSFKKDGVHITLAPCDPRKEFGPSSLVSKSVFTTLLKAEAPQLVLGLFLTESNPTETTIPPQVQPLLAEYMDVFSPEIPPGLPLIQDIQHCIDFVPGASIPNKPAYRMNPTEFNELNRQVQELLKKGLIHESMSPCAVPALLVPKPNGTFRMCIESRAVNKITIKYRFPIPRFDYLLDHLHGARVLQRLTYVAGTIRFGCMKAMNGKRLSKNVTGFTNGW
ncbi:uncharacterized protein LOC143560931 [Bidens hawaiensis]|uniref:uncharacterized protein LOC143560931 n=1 Tax=Bidens hawaiensis TaxID=980011 RepID=UPI004049AE48